MNKTGFFSHSIEIIDYSLLYQRTTKITNQYSSLTSLSGCSICFDTGITCVNSELNTLNLFSKILQG